MTTGAMDQQRQKELLALLRRILAQHPEGLTEYDLLRKLRDMELPVFDRVDYHDPLRLYRAHFLLFHLLYTLRDRLRKNEEGDVMIHCLRIRLTSYRRDAESLPGPRDGLREYYLDLDRLEGTTRTEVEALLDRFWKHYADSGRRPECLEILGLSDPVSRETIRRRYRQLAMRYHPDRGGRAEDFRRISRAAAVLLA